MIATTLPPRTSRRETTVAVVASVLIHALVVIGAGALLAIPFLHRAPAPVETPEPLEITIMSEPSPPVAPQFIRTEGMEPATEPPKNAPFESDRDTLAASESAPTGTQDLPSAEGVESPTMEFQNREYTAGKEAQAATPPSPAQEAKPEEARKPQPAPTPVTTQLALLDMPRPTPQSAAEQKPATPPSPSTPRPPSAPGFQPQTRVTRIQGNISNRGRASVTSVGTPLGRYKKQVSDAIGSRWYYYVNDQIGLLNIGTVGVRFTVDAGGNVKNLRVLSNTSNESFASVSVNAIMQADIPPIPEDVSKLLDNSRLEIDYSFTILTN